MMISYQYLDFIIGVYETGGIPRKRRLWMPNILLKL